MGTQNVTTLEELLDSLRRAGADRDQVSIGRILEVVGRRSFGPILLFAGLITFAPLIGDIPGVPTIVGLLVLLVAVQLLFHRDHVWLPDWLLRRSASKDKLEKAVQKSRRPARAIDKVVHPRLTNLTSGRSANMILTASILICAATPLMELVPFSANVAGAALIAFGLALIAHDGLLALFALACTAGAAVLIVMYAF